MENIIVIALCGLVAASIYLKSNMLSVLGMLAFGWVLVYVTNNDAILYARSFVPVGGNNIDTITSLVLGFSPVTAAIVLTKNNAKKPLTRLLGVLLAPALVVVGWLTVLLAVAYDKRTELLNSWVQEQVGTYQVYALWVAAIAVILYLFTTTTKSKKHDK